jgi:hypothetical protein
MLASCKNLAAFPPVFCFANIEHRPYPLDRSTHGHESGPNYIARQQRQQHNKTKVSARLCGVFFCFNVSKYTKHTHRQYLLALSRGLLRLPVDFELSCGAGVFGTVGASCRGADFVSAIFARFGVRGLFKRSSRSSLCVGT